MIAKQYLAAVFAALLAAHPAPASGQSKIPGAPSNAPKIGVDVTGHAEGIGDKIEAVFFNIDMVATYLREEKIKGHLAEYLREIGAKPTPGEVHLFYVQALLNDSGNVVELRDYQYLTHGKTTVDAIRESFTLEGAPGTEDKLHAILPGTRLAGVYVSAHPNGDGYIIIGGSLTKEFYQKIRQEGLALRETRAKERAEAERIQEKRQQMAATHSANDGAAHAQLARDTAKGPLPPGPALFPSEVPQLGSTVYLPPTKSGPMVNAGPAQAPTKPAVHPPVKFSPPPPSTKPVEVGPLD